MPSYQISVTPSRRAAARYIAKVRREFLKALAEENASRGLTQSEIARIIGVHRSVISRELRGKKDITMGRAGELAFALGREADFALPSVDEVRKEGALCNEPRGGAKVSNAGAISNLSVAASPPIGLYQGYLQAQAAA